MNGNSKSRMITCLFFLVAMIPFSVQLSAQENSETVGYEEGLYYTVHEGDTLWDISDRFSDSPWLWPDLWSENSQIPNPHWIYPGERIRLFHLKGTETFSQKNIKKSGTIEPEKAKAPLYYYYSPINSIGFIRKYPVNSQGILFKVKDDKKLISVGDLVYVRQTGDTPLEPGRKYSVYRTFKPIVDEKTNALIGTQHYLTGIVKIIKKGPGFTVGTIVQSYRTIALNDLLMPYQKRSPKIAMIESKQELNGKIIGSEERANIMGDEDIAFIDKGSKDGVKPGQFYSIFYQQRQEIDPNTKGNALLSPVVYGKLLVLHTEQTTSTVLITRAEKSINPGATIRSPME